MSPREKYEETEREREREREEDAHCAQVAPFDFLDTRENRAVSTPETR